MSSPVNHGGTVKLVVNSTKAAEPKVVSPLERARQIVSGMVRNEKEFRWLGVRMENFLRVHERRMEAMSIKEVCDYLEGLMRKGQADWQVKQSLDAIGLLMLHGYQREGLRIPELREAWGLRLNERLGISVGDLKSRATAKASSPEGAAGTEIPINGVTDRLRRVLRVAHYAIKTEKAYTQWWDRFEQFSDGRATEALGPDDVRSFLEHLAVERKDVPVVALRLPPANFSNRFAVKHTNHNYVHNITNLAVDSTRAHDLSLNRFLSPLSGLRGMCEL